MYTSYCEQITGYCRPERRIQRGTAVTTETFDNFDIDGSVHQGPGEERGLLGGHEVSPASPLLRPSSPGGMSWNSHTHYQQFKVGAQCTMGNQWDQGHLHFRG